MPQLNKLIIFDMDNTLIHSHLDFPLMKSAALRLLEETGRAPQEELPLTQIMNLYRQNGWLDPQLEARIWQRVDEIEYAGLAGSVPEPAVEQALEFLSKHAHLAVLTNTKQEAARDILAQLGLERWLEHIMGRGGAPQLKPAPGGMLALLARYPRLRPLDALAVGDALIDIRAARAAGLRFCAYNRSRAEQWTEREHQPELRLTSWEEPAARLLLALLDCGVADYG